MSLATTGAVWRYSKQKGTALLVLLAIADWINDAKGSVAWPSVEALAERVRLSVRQVQRVIRELIRAGELQIIPNQGPHGTNLYKIGLPCDVIRDGQGSRDNQSTPALTLLPSAGDTRVTQSVKEPLKESTPVVPKGDYVNFWIGICFKCFKLSPYPIPTYIRRRLELSRHLDRRLAESLLEFYRSEDLETKRAPYNSRRHSPERLMLDLVRQIALAARTSPPPPPKKEEPLHWREFFRWKYKECILPRSFYDLDRHLRDEYEQEVGEFEKEFSKNHPTLASERPNLVADEPDKNSETTNPQSATANEPPKWLDFFRWKYGPEFCLPTRFCILSDAHKREYYENFEAFVEATDSHRTIWNREKAALL